jgi:hypothetical protein
MHPELILIACAVLAAVLVPSLITARPRYIASEKKFLRSADTGSQPTE